MTVLCSRAIRPLADLELRTDERGRAWWAKRRDVEEEALVGQARHVWLDPRSGAGFAAAGQRLTQVIQWPHRTRLPSRMEWARGALGARRVREPAVSLRDVGMETNWYHFLVDLLGGRLRLADEIVGPDVPGIVPAGLPDQAKGLLGRAGFRRREWVVQPQGQWLHVDELTVVRAPRHDPATIPYLWEQLAVPPSDPAAEDRLLVMREPRTGREWANQEEMMDVARRYGLQVIRPASEPLDDQIERFGRASLVVGAHGAGLTGILWRREAPLSVIDIQVRGRAEPMWNFASMSARMGARYFAVGEGLWTGFGGDAQGSQGARWKEDALCVDTVGLARLIESCLDGS